ncbi:MAG TPA: DUF4956 domain-containing protein [Pelotomaculum sp.]|nr:DUF4956 domain-containing protein [Pelotomaculum sp.]
MLDSLLALTSSASISMGNLLLCTLASLVLGLGVAGIYMYRNNYTKNFVVTLALLPAMVQLVIMIVNGNLGVGVAVMGAFSLVRFRSIPGSSREIGSLFFAMAVGLATGMGYLAIAALFLLIVGLMTMLLNTVSFGEQKTTAKELRITIPENLDYAGLFDDLFSKYTQKSELVRVKTTNMGSLYELRYHIALKGTEIEKSFLDELRCRNGNLNIAIGRVTTRSDEL